MASRPHDQVIMHGDPQSFARIRDLAGKVDIGAAGGRVAAWMIVDQHTQADYRIDFT